MSVQWASRWFRPPHHLLSWFLAMTVVLAGTLVWLGWRLFDQDRALERQRVRDHLESAADLVGGALARRLTETDERVAIMADLPDGQIAAAAATLSDEDAAVVVIRSDRVDAHPRGRLAYAPVVSPIEPASEVFAEGEALEFRRGDFSAASAAFRSLARSADPAIRAGALLRLARTLRKSRQTEAALAVYDELFRLGSTPVEGVPADLLARHARGTLAEQAQRSEDLRREAAALDADLTSGRWLLSRAAFGFYRQESRRWLGRGPRTAAEAAHERASLARAAVIESFWTEWTRRTDLPSAGRRTSWAEDRAMLLVWRGTRDRVVSLVLGPDYVAGPLMRDIEPMLDREGVRVALTDADGRQIAGPAIGQAPEQIVRTPAETKLPWGLRVFSRDARGDLGVFAARRRLIMMGLATLSLFVLAGGAVIGRAITRELEAARMQKDFVSAVSHEFRTPLASMLQLSELLSDGRVPSEAKRQQYYERLQRESGRLHRLVESLLDFGRMEAGAREYRFETVDPTDLVRSVGREFSDKVTELGYHVETTVEPELPSIRADRESLHLGLWNLLDNAVKYSPMSKTVWLDAVQENGGVAIRVRDRGLGIDPADQKRIFKKFVRTASARTAGIKGTGLGLAIVHHIVAAHGGEIRLTSEPGAGSVFTLLLPLSKGRP